MSGRARDQVDRTAQALGHASVEAVERAVDRAAVQRRDEGRRVGDDLERQLGDLGQAGLAPVAVEALHGDLLAALPAHELERAGAHDADARLAEALRVLDRVRLAHDGAHRAHRRHVLPLRVRVLELDRDLRRAGQADALDVRVVERAVGARLRLHDALHAEDDVLRSHHRAVPEMHARAHLVDVGERVRDFQDVARFGSSDPSALL